MQVLLPPGQDPHTCGFTSKQITAPKPRETVREVRHALRGPDCREAGRRFARTAWWVDAAQGIQKRPIDAPCIDDGHDHDAECEHGNAARDPHVWLSPLLLKIQAKNIAAAFEQMDPAHAEDYRRNLAALLGRPRCRPRPHRGRTEDRTAGSGSMCFIRRSGYFADAYGLRQEAIEAGGKSPGQKELVALIQKAREDGAKIIFVQPQFDRRTAETVAESIAAAGWCPSIRWPKTCWPTSPTWPRRSRGAYSMFKTTTHLECGDLSPLCRGVSPRGTQFHRVVFRWRSETPSYVVKKKHGLADVYARIVLASVPTMHESGHKSPHSNCGQPPMSGRAGYRDSRRGVRLSGRARSGGR